MSTAVIKPVTLKTILQRSIVALKAQASDIAGHSQAPDLIHATDTQEWQDAEYLIWLLGYTFIIEEFQTIIEENT